MENNLAADSVFLDGEIINAFRKMINSSPVFRNVDEYKQGYNLVCVFMDRIDSAVAFLNEHQDTPKTEEEFICFLVYTAILRDGINKLYENVFHCNPTYIYEKKSFCNAVIYKKPFFSEDNCPTDDDFFEYLRAMAFAHPFEVSSRGNTRPFMKKGEKHFCPWVIVRNGYSSFDDLEDGVGIRIYSSEDQEGITDVTFSFSSLKEFIKTRYNSIKELTKLAEEGILDQNKKWKEIKVNRDQEPLGILKSIIEIMESRFEDSFIYETAADYLSCHLSDNSNSDCVALFRNEIIKIIPAVCDCIDECDYEGAYDAMSIVEITPKRMHHGAHYQLEKIFSYLDEESDRINPLSDEKWGLKQAELFSKGFAKKWVAIDVQNMSYAEIRLLVQVACYLEAKEQTQNCSN